MHDGHSVQDHSSHARDHDHGSAHDHDHGSAHAHDHVGNAVEGRAKIAAVLDYTLAHNAQHAEELGILSRKLRRAGFDDAADALDAAGEDFLRGDEKLSAALRLLKGVTD
jgi:hypothetical protein